MNGSLGMSGVVTIYLAPRQQSGPAGAGRRCRRGQAADPGTSRALIVPLFGLAPGGVWPPLRRRSRPGALTARFHPCPRLESRWAVCFCATFRLPRRTNPSAIAWALPSTLPGGARTFLPLHQYGAKGGHPVRTALRRQSSIGPYRGQMKHPPAPGQSRLEFWMPCNPSFRRKPESRRLPVLKTGYGQRHLDSS